MPGIVGLVTKLPADRARAELHRMVDALCHEPFYRTGTWADEALGVYVGWVAREGSFADGMPLENERGDAVLVFAGEEFPEPGNVERLRARGHHVATGGPSYLVHVYEEDGRFPRSLNGRFHGLACDRVRGTAMLFNDRYGMHRLYYHESKEAFYFAAEAKGILAVRPELRQVDVRGLGEFLACGCVLENRSLFSGIHVLPPGAAWVFGNGSLERKGTYFEAHEWEQQGCLDPATYYAELKEALARNLPRYFKSPEPLAMSLTGGLDTRMIMAWYGSAPGSLRCYTFGGMFRDSQDVRVARQVARACEQPHDVIHVGEKFLARFPHFAERTVYLTDGCADVSRAPDLYVNEVARAIAPVRMTGNYGGEVLRRVRAFKPVEPEPDVFKPELLSWVREASDTYDRVARVHPLSFAVFRQAPWHHYGLLALEQTQLSLRSPYLDNDFVRTVFRAPESAVATNDVCLRLISEGNRALDMIQTDRGRAGRLGGLGTAASHSLREFQFKAEYAYDYGMPHWVAGVDRLLSPLHLERLFLGRHKFYHFRIWYRDALAPCLRDMLLDPRSRSRAYLSPKALDAIVNGHLSGRRNYTLVIHKLLTLELVHRLFIDSAR